MDFSDHLIKNSLFQIKKTKRYIRIIHINENNEDLFAIEFNENGHAERMPGRHDVMSFWDRVENKELIPIEDDDDKFLKGDITLSEAEQKRIDRLLELFLPLLEKHSHIYYKGSRNKLIKDFIKTHPNFEKSIYRKFKEFWVGGCNGNAWISDYKKCGAPGEIREPGSKKRGRKKKNKKAPKGINIGKKERWLIKQGAIKYKGRLLDEAYNQTIKDNYGVKKKGETIVNWAIVPSYDQFIHWRKKLLSASSILINEIGEKEYNLNERPKRNTANKHVFGIGSCYQIDATLDNVHLVSSVGRVLSIGKPTLYIVRDVYSRMIVGFYLTTQPASGIVARLALENTALDKVEFCKRYGINITRSQWPAMHLPKELFADNAELVSEKTSSIIKRFGVTIRNSRTGRGDDKSIVEHGFFLLQNRMKGSLKNNGGIGRKFGKRGSKDTRKDSRITLRDYTRMIIEAIIEYNNSHPIKGYPFTEGMQRAGFTKAIPIKLWEFAKTKGLVCFSKYNHKTLWRGLMPIESCSVSDTGIKFMGNWWAPIDKEIDNFVHQHYLSRQGKLNVAYDPRFNNEVYLVHKEKFHNLKMTGDPARYDNLFELLAWNESVKESLAASQQKERTVKMTTNDKFKDIITEGKNASPSIPVRLNKTEKGRRDEQNQEKVSELRYRQSQERPSKKSNHPISSYRTGRSSSRREINSLKKTLKKKKI